MTNKVDISPHRTWVAVVLIIIGFLFLLDTLDIVHFGRTFAQWWPVILIVIGFMKLRGRDKMGGAVLFVLGIAFLSATLNIINWGSIFRFWPLILIVIGLSMFLKSRGGTLWGIGTLQETPEDLIRSNAIFGGASQTVTSQNFKGGDVMALFGGVELDLSRAKISPEGCTLTLTALFGGIEVTVPTDWHVSVSGTPVLGGIENKTVWKEGEETKVLCRCTVAFGGVEIRN